LTAFAFDVDLCNPAIDENFFAGDWRVPFEVVVALLLDWESLGWVLLADEPTVGSE
jgi:hypothetical protein